MDVPLTTPFLHFSGVVIKYSVCLYSEVRCDYHFIHFRKNSLCYFFPNRKRGLSDGYFTIRRYSEDRRKILSNQSRLISYVIQSDFQKDRDSRISKTAISTDIGKPQTLKSNVLSRKTWNFISLFHRAVVFSPPIVVEIALLKDWHFDVCNKLCSKKP